MKKIKKNKKKNKKIRKKPVIKISNRNNPTKSLLTKFFRNPGRSRGQVTSRFRFSGHKRRYRIIDFGQNKLDIPAKVAKIEYDPNRTSFIAQINFVDGEKRYILAPHGLKVGDQIQNGEKSPIKIGCRLRLKNIPLGTVIYNIELNPEAGGRISRSAGSSATLSAKEGKYAILQMPSKETRKILLSCYASIGRLSHPEHEEEVIGKAGRNIWRGKKAHVRGKAMDPSSHPHGGGEGQNPIGMPGPKTPWGKPTLGYKTRKRKYSDKLIIKRRK